MNPLRATAPLAAALSLLAVTACTCPRFESERTEEFALSAEAASRLVGRTHNGDIRIVAGGDGEVRGVARIVGVAETPEDAELVRDRIVLRHVVDGDTVDIGWDWTEDPDYCESGSVSFELTAPPTWHLALATHNGDVVLEGVAQGGLDVETHNGDVTADGSRGTLRATSHNGRLEFADHEGPVELESHNGGIAVSGAIDAVRIESHNGAIALRSTGSGPIAGVVTSHNGGVAVDVGARSTRLDIDTSNGDIDLDLGDTGRVTRVGDGEATIDVGPAVGDARLWVETHNGDVTVGAADSATPR